MEEHEVLNMEGEHNALDSVVEHASAVILPANETTEKTLKQIATPTVPITPLELLIISIMNTYWKSAALNREFKRHMYTAMRTSFLVVGILLTLPSTATAGLLWHYYGNFNGLELYIVIMGVFAIASVALTFLLYYTFRSYMIRRYVTMHIQRDFADIVSPAAFIDRLIISPEQAQLWRFLHRFLYMVHTEWAEDVMDEKIRDFRNAVQRPTRFTELPASNEHVLVRMRRNASAFDTNSVDTTAVKNAFYILLPSPTSTTDHTDRFGPIPKSLGDLEGLEES